jgi:FkbM family methyltransferase
LVKAADCESNLKESKHPRFRALPIHLSIARKNLKNLTGATCVPLGCGAIQGTAKIIVKFEGCSGNSIIDSAEERSLIIEHSAEPAESIRSAPLEEITLTTIDTYCREQNVSRVDLVKVDAEGHDCDVIRGAQTMLKNGAIGMLQFEYNWKWIGARSFLRDVFIAIEGTTYSLGKITPKGIEFYERWTPALEVFRGDNFLICDPEWRKAFRAIDPVWLCP